tara:strand:+ start:143 stop:286 length:144 start_codon:yes stop_codon:yes gene_type:complete
VERLKGGEVERLEGRKKGKKNYKEILKIFENITPPTPFKIGVCSRVV